MTSTRPLGVHSLVWAGEWNSRTARSAIQRTKEAGFDLFELGCLDAWEIDIEMTSGLLYEFGLEVVGSLGLGSASDITSDNPEHVAEGKRLIRKAVDIVHDLGGKRLTGITYAMLGKYVAPPTSEGWSRSVSAFSEMADYAGERDISIGVEVVNRYDSNLINTARQAMDYLDQVDRSNTFVHLDTYHMNMEENDMMTPVLDCWDRLGYVHISESHRGYLGSGTIDFASFFAALDRIGFAGPITFESFSTKVVDPALSNVLGIWRDMWDDSLDLAKHAKNYIDALSRAAGRSAIGQPR